MEHYALEIITRTNGERSSFRTTAECERRGDGIAFFYAQEGDRVSLVLERERVSMHRSGEAELSLELVPDGESVLRMTIGASSGKTAVFTDRYTRSLYGNDLEAELVYRLGNSRNFLSFRLKIKAKRISEEK